MAVHDRQKRVVEKVLLVDDYELQLAAWARECTAAGKRVFCASGRATALEIALREQPDLVIVDLYLSPPDTGLDVVRDLRNLDPSTFLILVSARLSIELAMRGRDAGANDCIAKPVRCSRLIEQVENGHEPTTSGREHADHEVSQEADDLLDRFYDRITRLRDEAEAAPLMQEALRLIVKLAEAQLAYVELRSVAGQYVCGYGCNDDDLETVTKALSKTIIEQVQASNEPLILDSALDDPRFAEARSVKQNEIHQVIVFPVGLARGVVYLQGQAGRTMKPSVRTRVANFARQLAPVADRLLGESLSLSNKMRLLQRREVVDTLERNNGNISAAARELGITRTQIHRLLKKFGLR